MASFVLKERENTGSLLLSLCGNLRDVIFDQDLNLDQHMFDLLHQRNIPKHKLIVSRTETLIFIHALILFHSNDCNSHLIASNSCEMSYKWTLLPPILITYCLFIEFTVQFTKHMITFYIIQTYISSKII